MVKILLKYMLWAGIAGAGTAMVVRIFFNGIDGFFFGLLLTGVAGAAGAVMGLAGGIVGYLLGKLAHRPYEVGLLIAVIVGGVAGFLAFLFGCGLGC